jgi:hypothetical protein
LTAPDNHLGATTQLLDAGTLDVTGAIADAGSATISSLAELAATSNGTIQINGLTLAGGTISCGAASVFAVGATVTGGSGTITVDSGATLTGSGDINRATVVDDGSLVASGGTLTAEASVSGSGTLQIDAAAIFVEEGTLTVANVAFGSGGDAHLVVAVPIPTTPPQPLFSGFGTGDVIDLENLQAATLSFANGTLTLQNGDTVVETLLFAGDYTSANFTLSSDQHGGTDINYVATGADAVLPDFAVGATGGHSPHDVPFGDKWVGSIAGNSALSESTVIDAISNMLHHGLT